MCRSNSGQPISTSIHPVCLLLYYCWPVALECCVYLKLVIFWFFWPSQFIATQKHKVDFASVFLCGKWEPYPWIPYLQGHSGSWLVNASFLECKTWASSTSWKGNWGADCSVSHPGCWWGPFAYLLPGPIRLWRGHNCFTEISKCLWQSGTNTCIIEVKKMPI